MAKETEISTILWALWLGEDFCFTIFLCIHDFDEQPLVGIFI